MERHSFFYRILLPSLAAIALFLAAMYLFVIPTYRESLMDKKRETIRELTNTAWSVLQNLDNWATDSASLVKLQEEAAGIISNMRYGDEQKDYFWITDTMPRMIMHPYRPQLNGIDLSEYADTEGKRFFVEISQLVKGSGDGYIDYKWQWKDDSLVVVPKLSYVKLFEPWGWIIGTGIYVEDVQREISVVTRQVVWISFFITLIIGLIIIYLARRNYLAELLRKTAQERQREAMEKYKKLVESSSDGVLMTMNGEIVYCNPFLVQLMGFNPQEVDEKDEKLINSLNCFFQIQNHETALDPKGEGGEMVKELKVTGKSGQTIDVVLTRSIFDLEGKKGLIYTVKDVSRHKDVERELDLSMEKFKSIADMMNLGIFRCTLGRQSRFVEINNKALKLLGYNNLSELQELQVQDLFHEREEKKEVIRAVSDSLVLKDRLLHIRASDGSIIPVLVSLFPVKDVHDRMVYCDGILLDAYEHLSRDTGFHRNPVQISASVLLKPVKDFLMIPPVCDMETPSTVASRLMIMKNTDVIFVANEKKDIVGLITHSDVSRRVVAKQVDPETAIGKIMSAPVIAVSDKDMVVDAFSLMMEHKISYVALAAADGKPYGYISLLALSELRRNTPEYLIHAIQKAGSVEEVAELMKQLPRLIESLVETGTGSSTTGKLISRISDTITCKFIHETLDQMGQPPCPFVFLALGSEGRREQTLATDQDNAIIFLSDHPDDHRGYFLELGKQVCTLLDKAGYPFCQGGIMAMNPQWCLNLQEIQKRVATWIDTPNPQELLNAGVFFDFRPAHGDFAIAADLQRFCLDTARDKSVFIYNLVQATMSIKPKTAPLNKTSFGAGDKKEDMLDIKEPLLAITAIVRLWALKYGVSDKNTLERLLAMQTMNLLPTAFTEEFSQAFRYLTHLRVRNQLKNIAYHQPTSNKLHPASLTDTDRIMLKKIYSAITNHQARLGTEFRVV
jgi:PAS domain S-box-containing protein